MLEFILQTAKNSDSLILTNKEKTKLINSIPFELTTDDLFDFYEAVETLKDTVSNIENTNTLMAHEVIEKVSFFVNNGVPYEIVIDFMKSKEASYVFLEKDLESSLKKLKSYADISVESLDDGDDIADSKSNLYKQTKIA